MTQPETEYTPQYDDEDIPDDVDSDSETKYLVELPEESGGEDE